MKLVRTHTLIRSGRFSESNEWSRLREDLHDAVRRAEWPVGAGSFTIRPVLKGNGVVPIKSECMRRLIALGWQTERRLSLASGLRQGAIDAVYETSSRLVAMEWETGNISSSHRAMNKLAMGLYERQLAAATLVVPSRNFYQYLTDRIGNEPELEPYFPLWKSIPVSHGVLEIVVIEQDAESLDAPLIPKGTDGRARR